MLNNVRLLLFAEGLISVSIQFLYMRHLLPHVGSSVVVSSLIVSVFLLFLAIGYHRGGNVKAHHANVLSRNFLKAAILLCIGLSPWTSEIFFFYTGEATPLYLKLAGYLTLFMAGPVFWLGQTMPLLANSVKEESKGKVSSTVLVYSTIGNVVGGLISVIVLMRYFGLATTVFVNIAGLLSLYLLTVEKINVNASLRVVSVTGLALLAVLLTESAFYNRTTQYANYEIAKSKDKSSTIFIANKLPHSLLTADGLPFQYISFARSQLARLRPEQRDVLVLGSGGFTLSMGDKTRDYTYVDIDEQIKNLAEKTFLKAPINGTFIAADARQFLIHQKQQRDAILVDVYSDRLSIPYHLETKEAFELVRRALKPDGIAMINTVQTRRFADLHDKRLHRTITHTFDTCTTTEIDPGTEPNPASKLINVMYVCTAEKKGAEIYEDAKIMEF